MRKSWSVCLVSISIILSAAQLPAGDHAYTGRGEIVRVSEPISGTYIVVLNDRVTDVDAAARRLAERNGAVLTRTYRAALKGFAVASTESAARAIAAEPIVRYVQENGTAHTFGNQPGAPWGLDRIDRRDLPLNTTYNWNHDGTGVNAYVLDTGIRFTHREFEGRATSGFDAVDGATADDCNGHGTHVAATLGGATRGVAKNVNLIAVRVCDCSGNCSTEQILAGVDWVTANHVKPAVANMSLGTRFSTDPAIDEAVENSIAAGVSYAVAAGNEGDFPLGLGDACNHSPANVLAANTVAASTLNDTRPAWANWGPCVDYFAPGEDITSAWNTSDTATNTISGTSMASPHVAGVIALYLQDDPTATPERVTTAITNAASKDKLTNDLKGSPNLLLYSLVASYSLPPVPPSDLTATTVSESQIDLAWTDNSDNEDGFKIERCQADLELFWCDGFVEIAQVAANVTTYNDGVSWCTAWRYRVRAFNAGGNSDYSNEAEAINGWPPAAPTGLTATAASASQINLAWTDNSWNEQVFAIERCAGSGCANFAVIDTVGANATTYSDPGLAASTTYRYRVRAYTWCLAGQDSNYSNEAEETTRPASPAAPTNLVATPGRDGGGSFVILTWNDQSSDEDNFIVERCTGASCSSFAPIATAPANATSYTDNTTARRTNYSYRVKARRNPADDSAYSNVASTRTK